MAAKNSEKEMTELEKWVSVLKDPRVIVLILLSLSAGSLVRHLVSTATGGMIDLSTKETDTLECVSRVLDSPDFEDSQDRIAAVKACLPEE